MQLPRHLKELSACFIAVLIDEVRAANFLDLATIRCEVYRTHVGGTEVRSGGGMFGEVKEGKEQVGGCGGGRKGRTEKRIADSARAAVNLGIVRNVLNPAPGLWIAHMKMDQRGTSSTSRDRVARNLFGRVRDIRIQLAQGISIDRSLDHYRPTHISHLRHLRCLSRLRFTARRATNSGSYSPKSRRLGLVNLECERFVDQLFQPLHVGSAAGPARIVGPSVDIFLRPSVVHRSEFRHRIEHRVVVFFARYRTVGGHLLYLLHPLALFRRHIFALDNSLTVY